jgi:hypothetical protein
MAACGDNLPTDPTVSFSLDVVPILQNHCGGCHLKNADGAGEMTLGTQAEFAYEAIVGVGTVIDDCAGMMRVDTESNDPMQSSLYLKIIGTSCGKLMPAGKTPKLLSEEQIETIRVWIAEGAHAN